MDQRWAQESKDLDFQQEANQFGAGGDLKHGGFTYVHKYIYIYIY